jgi:hypothetical protein
MNSLKKTLFLINVNNVVDIITNSSSELFVLKGETKEIVEEMISNVYPNYLDEYDNVKKLSELSADDLSDFMSYHCSPGVWPARKCDYRILDGFTFDELYRPEKDYKTGGIKPPAWNGEIQYSFNHGLITKENKEEYSKRLDPNGTMFFLFSLDENPDWEMQEKLMEIADRYHLG